MTRKQIDFPSISRRSKWTIVAALSLVIALAFVLSARGCKQGPAERKVGAIFTLTGNTADWSLDLQKGMEIAIDEENRSSSQPVRVIYEDVQAKPSLATTAFQKLSSVDRVDVAMSVFTPITEPVAPMAEQAGTPLLATVTSVRNIARGRKWVYRDFPTQDQMATPLGHYAVRTMRLKRGGALVVSDDYGRDGARAFQEPFTARGGVWVGTEEFKQNDMDMRSQCAKLVAQKPDALMVVGRNQSFGIALKQLRESGFKGQIFSVNCLDEPTVWDIAGEAVEGALFTSAFFDPAHNPEAQAFEAEYRKRHGRSANYVAVYGYSIMKYLVPILRSSAGDRGKIIEQLARLQTASIRGPIHAEPDHDIVSQVALYRVKNKAKVIEKDPNSLAESQRP